MAPTISEKADEGCQNEDSLPSLLINGKCYKLGPEVPPETTLVNFIRENVRLTGTKAICHEGGCGLCTVLATSMDSSDRNPKTFSIRACQQLVYSCVGWSITTIEDLGNKKIGYDRIQKALHGFYGTQCGYCSPGFIMTMKGEMATNENLTVETAEKALDGNLCRCTGYRPILDAFKSLAQDSPAHLSDRLKDIEDSYEMKCERTGQKCTGQCGKEQKSLCSSVSLFRSEKRMIVRDGITWHYPKTVEDIYSILRNSAEGEKIRLVVGNTGQGVYKNDGPYNIYVNTTGVGSLYEHSTEPKVVIGANVSLEDCIKLFLSASQKVKGYHHLEEVAKHWQFVANVGVRNVGCWAGNLKMKHDHPGFTSDIFISLLAIDTVLKIGDSDGNTCLVTLDEFLSTDMNTKIILSMEIPPQPKSVIVKEYKITPRAVNAHAYVNASFRLHVDPEDKMRLLNRPAIVFGGINPKFARAEDTEKYLVGKCLSDPTHVQEAIRILGEELSPDSQPQDASPEFRKSLAQSLLYKTILNILGDSVPENLRSGGSVLVRPISSSKQTYDENADTWPLGKPVEKLESTIQLSGEAEYMDDILPMKEELFGAFVQSTVGKGIIKSIDSKSASNISGFVDFITAKDIPGKNSFFAQSNAAGPDPIFASDEIKYHGQAIGLVVATSRRVAKEAAKAIKVTYGDVTKPILTIKEAITGNRVGKSANPITMNEDPISLGDVAAALQKSTNVIEGEISFGSQSHFTMEPLAARVVPVEDGYDVWCTTQWPTEAQNVVCGVLNLPANSVNVSCRRIGGGYGGKISRPHILVGAAAIAAYKLESPVRVNLDLAAQLTLVGAREPYLIKYRVGFTDGGELEAIDTEIYSDVGHVANENSSVIAALGMPSVYHSPNWKIQCFFVNTDTPANTWCRTPGHAEGIAAMENIIERIAEFVGKDPMEIRELNFSHEDKPQMFSLRQGDNLVKDSLLPLLKTQAGLEDRIQSVQEFNKANRWKKRGISVMPLRYPFDYLPFHYNVHVVIYEEDGSVAIKHGGIEMGQGINTKVAQVAAHVLKVPLDLIKVKQTDTFAGANSFVTGGSHGSDLNPHGVRICCERIRKRMDEVGEKIESNNGPLSWKDLVKKCFAEQVDLCERYFTFAKEHPKGYDIWTVACTEVEVDVLTGQFMILRTDIIEDCGRSLSPYVDMGQVEGAFVMGMGFFTSEKVKYDTKTGEKLSNGTWEYKIPTALDIPIDFRVTFAPGGDNPPTVLRSKATGEPPLCVSYSVITALRQAIKSARSDAGNSGWFEIDIPLTVDKIYELCTTSTSQFHL